MNLWTHLAIQVLAAEIQNVVLLTIVPFVRAFPITWAIRIVVAVQNVF